MIKEHRALSQFSLGAVEGGFAADGSEELPDLSKHQSLVAEVLSKIPDLYSQLKERQTKLGIKLARCIKAAIDTPESTDACQGLRRDMEAAPEKAEKEVPPRMPPCLRVFVIVLFNFTTSIMLVNSVKCLYDLCGFKFPLFIASMHMVFSWMATAMFGASPDGEGQVLLPMAERIRKHLDPSGDVVHSVQLRAARNIHGFRFLPAMDRTEKGEVEMLVAKAVRGLAPAVTGVYLPLRQSISYAPRAGTERLRESSRHKHNRDGGMTGMLKSSHGVLWTASIYEAQQTEGVAELVFDLASPRGHRPRWFVEGLVEVVVDDETETCAICLDEMYETSARRLPCGHCFHTACVKTWLLTKSRKCPLCNQTVDTSPGRSPCVESCCHPQKHGQ
eukprot:g20605.t1